MSPPAVLQSSPCYSHSAPDVRLHLQIHLAPTGREAGKVKAPTLI